VGQDAVARDIVRELYNNVLMCRKGFAFVVAYFHILIGRHLTAIVGVLSWSSLCIYIL
jgi:hypothetical protein